MTGRELPADGATVWRVTSAAGVRMLRLRKDGTALPLPGDAVVEAVTAFEADDFAASSPAGLLELWRLAEAQQPRWGWVLWQIPPAAAPAGWTLLIEDPHGAEQRYTWVRAGDEYRPTCAWEQRRRAFDQLTAE